MKKLKYLIVFMLVAVSMAFTFNNSELPPTKEVISIGDDYSQGWKDGYCEGWKDVKGQMALCPLTPLCPLPKLECMEGYRCGYNRGFKAGMRAAHKSK